MTSLWEFLFCPGIHTYKGCYYIHNREKKAWSGRLTTNIRGKTQRCLFLMLLTFLWVMLSAPCLCPSRKLWDSPTDLMSVFKYDLKLTPWALVGYSRCSQLYIPMERTLAWIMAGIGPGLYEGPNGKHFQLCRPYELCCNCPALASVVPKQPYTVCKWMGMAVFQ